MNQVNGEYSALAPDQAPWFLGELTRLTARVELARRSVESKRGLDEILAKHQEARGGLGKHKAIQSMIAKGVLEVGGGLIFVLLVIAVVAFVGRRLRGLHGVTGKRIRILDGISVGVGSGDAFAGSRTTL